MSLISRCLAGAAMVLASVVTAGAQMPAPVPLTASHRDGFLVYQNPDSSFRYWLDGRLQIDAASYRGSENKLANGTEVRRARLGGKFDMYRDWHGEIDIDFTKNEVEMKDVWMGYQGFDKTLIKAGNFKEPFSLETLTSSKYITFMERSYIDNLSPDRAMGIAVSRWGSFWQASGAVLGQTAGSVDASGRSEGYAYTGRLTVAPINSTGRLLHFGGAMSKRTPNGDPAPDTNTVRFRARPESNVSQARFLTTGKIRLVDHYNLYNAEFASVYDRASIQAEYTSTTVHRLNNLESPMFSGGYVFLSYFLTGETRQYLVEEGEFDRVYPISKRGAWEVAARWSSLDLNDPTTGVAIAGGKGVNYTFALNWYMNPNFKWMLNYVRVNMDDNAKPDMGIAPFKVNDYFTIVQSRFSIAF